jgi:hypothetical protein
VPGAEQLGKHVHDRKHEKRSRRRAHAKDDVFLMRLRGRFRRHVTFFVFGVGSPAVLIAR